MTKDQIKERCEWATHRVQAIVGGDNYWFQYNEHEWMFEFWERRGPIKQLIFPLELNGEPLRNITDWEVHHAVNFVRSVRHQRAQEEYFNNKKYEQYEVYKNS